MKLFYKPMSSHNCLKWVYAKAISTTCLGTEEATSAHPNWQVLGEAVWKLPSNFLN